ncbi:MAG TPA: hypothetical protein DC024_07095 [Clostridiales bacterium]|jgi:hypothetical protein|nr:hypothetical protein [Clostridiales bacterium]HBX87902.1 hypothetical protein [Marinilabiliaceae bacterium]
MADFKLPTSVHGDKDEMIKTTQVDKDKIVCKTCEFGEGEKRYFKGVCSFYPVKKPDKVLFEGANCKHYIKIKK